MSRVEPFFKSIETFESIEDEAKAFFNIQDVPQASRPYVYANVLTSLDGKLGFTECRMAKPGSLINSDTSRAADFAFLKYSWSQADAVLLSGAILRNEPELEGCMGEVNKPLQIILTESGDIDTNHHLLNSGLRCIFAVPSETYSHVSQKFQKNKIIEFSSFDKLLTKLSNDFGVKRLNVCTGGIVLSQLISMNLVDEVRHSISLKLVGDFNGAGHKNPSLVPSSVGDFSKDLPAFTLLGLREFNRDLLILRYCNRNL
jgi:riboflavin biosynthesis pyrimidine reductase